MGSCSSLEGDTALGGCGAFWRLCLPVGLWRFITWLYSNHSLIPMMWIGTVTCSHSCCPQTTDSTIPFTPWWTGWIFWNPELMSICPTWHFSFCHNDAKGTFRGSEGDQVERGVELTHETEMGRGLSRHFLAGIVGLARASKNQHPPATRKLRTIARVYLRISELMVPELSSPPHSRVLTCDMLAGSGFQVQSQLCTPIPLWNVLNVPHMHTST